MEVSLWQYLFLPDLWRIYYKDLKAKKETVREIVTVKGKFASLEILLRSMI
jgi:hypothetical protein